MMPHLKAVFQEKQEQRRQAAMQKQIGAPPGCAQPAGQSPAPGSTSGPGPVVTSTMTSSVLPSPMCSKKGDALLTDEEFAKLRDDVISSGSNQQSQQPDLPTQQEQTKNSQAPNAGEASPGLTSQAGTAPGGMPGTQMRPPGIPHSQPRMMGPPGMMQLSRYDELLNVKSSFGIRHGWLHYISR